MHKIEIKYFQRFGNLLIGNKYINGLFVNHVITNFEERIKEGIYIVGYEQTITPLTQKYLNNPKYKEIGFTRHIEINGVYDGERLRDGLYFHPFNYAKDSDGCIADVTTYNEKGGWQSFDKYKDFYKWFQDNHSKGVVCEITYNENVL